MKHSVKHTLDQATAKRVAAAAWDSYQQRFAKYNPQIDWVEDHRAKIAFSAKGLSLEGALQLSEGSIDMELDVPFILQPFKKKAVSVIEEEIQRWVRKAEQGEL